MKAEIREIRHLQAQVDREKSRLILTEKAGMTQILVPTDLYGSLLEDVDLSLYLQHESAVEAREAKRRSKPS